MNGIEEKKHGKYSYTESSAVVRYSGKVQMGLLANALGLGLALLLLAYSPRDVRQPNNNNNTPHFF